MRPLNSPRMHVVRKEEKEARLSNFLTAGLDRLAAAGGQQPMISVVARSWDSPVIRALGAQADVLAKQGILVRTLVVIEDRTLPEDMSKLAGALKCRACSDPRLQDAHEQLVIGEDVSWIGDCMRRDPQKRDAYECYSEGCAEAAAAAMRSFERLWKLSRSAKTNPSAAAVNGPRSAAVIEVALAALTDGEPAPAASTRH